MRREIAGLVFVAAASCVDFNSSDQPRRVSTTLTVVGDVVSTSGSTPIPGAVVDLGGGGHFSLPVVLAKDTADASGHFSFHHTVTHDEGGCGIWVGASAPGYETSDPAFSVTFLTCTAASQTVQVRLTPKP